MVQKLGFYLLFQLLFECLFDIELNECLKRNDEMMKIMIFKKNVRIKSNVFYFIEQFQVTIE
jgi:hypothetical protein